MDVPLASASACAFSSETRCLAWTELSPTRELSSTGCWAATVVLRTAVAGRDADRRFDSVTTGAIAACSGSRSGTAGFDSGSRVCVEASAVIFGSGTRKANPEDAR